MSLPYRVSDNGLVPIIDIMRVAKRNITTVKNAARSMNMQITPGVHFKQRWGKQHIDAINMKDAQPLIDYLAQLKTYSVRNPDGLQFRPHKRWNATQKAKRAKLVGEAEKDIKETRAVPQRRRVAMTQDAEETFADFEATARKLLRLATKFGIQELSFSDGKLEYTRTTSVTATIEK